MVAGARTQRPRTCLVLTKPSRDRLAGNLGGTKGHVPGALSPASTPVDDDPHANNIPVARHRYPAGVAGQPAWSRVETTSSARSTLSGLPVTAAKNSSRPRVLASRWLIAVTVAVLGIRRSSAISPND